MPKFYLDSGEIDPKKLKLTLRKLSKKDELEFKLTSEDTVALLEYNFPNDFDTLYYFLSASIFREFALAFLPAQKVTIEKTSTLATPSLSGLPAEIQYGIAEKLGISDLIALGQVNKQFQHIAADILFKKVLGLDTKTGAPSERRDFLYPFILLLASIISNQQALVAPENRLKLKLVEVFLKAIQRGIEVIVLHGKGGEAWFLFLLEVARQVGLHSLPASSSTPPARLISLNSSIFKTPPLENFFENLRSAQPPAVSCQRCLIL